MKTPVTAGRLKQHFTYNWWKYLLIVAVSIGLVDLLYSVTAYRPPREKTLGFYIYGYMNEPDLTAYLDNVRESELPEMEEAGEGDLYLIQREDFLNYAANGTLVPLENDAVLMQLFDSAGVSLQSGWRRETETGETHLYGIPLDKLPGLLQYAYAEDGYLCMVVSGRNEENAAELMRILCRDMIPEPEAKQNGQP